MAARSGRFCIHETCIGCGACEHACPVDCIHDARVQGMVGGSGGRIRELQA